MVMEEVSAAGSDRKPISQSLAVLVVPDGSVAVVAPVPEVIAVGVKYRSMPAAPE